MPKVIADRLAGLYRELAPRLAAEGIRILRWTELDASQARVLQAMFSTRIFPVLTPLAVDPGHPFPYISNLSLNLAIRVEDPDTHLIHFARVKIPPLLGRFVSPEPGIFVPLEDVIAANLDRLFPGMRVLERHVFRVTRNADLEVDDDGAEDLLEALEEEIRRRRTSPAVRLELEEGMPPEMRNLLARELQVGPADIYTVPGPLHLAGLAELQDLDRPDLKDAPFQGRTPSRLVATDLAEADIFAVLRAGDLLVQHPYDSFGTTVERLIEQAAADPNVLAIKQTLYRTSGAEPDRGGPGRSGSGGQAGRGPGGDQGALRRAGEHRLGPHAGECGLPRDVRHAGPQDPLEAVPGRSRRGRRDSALRARWDWKLQPDDRPDLRGHRPPHCRS